MSEKTWGTAHRISNDGVLDHHVITQAHEPGKIVTAVTQPSRNHILGRNQRMRNEKVTKDLSFGRHVACVPLEDMEALKKKYPGLRSRDGKVRTKTWASILTDPANKKYLVVEKY